MLTPPVRSVSPGRAAFRCEPMRPGTHQERKVPCKYALRHHGMGR
jgi:hypothetical protein